MTTRKTSSTKAVRVTPPVVEPEEEYPVGSTRERELDHDVTVFEVLVEKRTKKGAPQKKWQPTGRMVPVLLIKSPNTFKDEHEYALRREPQIEIRREKVVRGILKKHTRDGELYFELGETEADADRVIKYAIDLLKGYGVDATRAIRFTPYMSRTEW